MNKELEELIKAHLVYFLLIIIALVFGVYLLIEPGKKVCNNFKSLQEKKETLVSKQQELDDLKATMKEKERTRAEEERIRLEKAKHEKPIFKTSVQSEDSFSTNAPLFEDIIKLLKSSQLRLISIENKTTGFDDPIVQNGGATYNTCMVSMQILGSYMQFQKFLKYLFDYPYLINISSINAIPFDKDKEKLIINLSIILYSENEQTAEMGVPNPQTPDAPPTD